MNKKLYSLMLTLLALTGLMSSCSNKEDIVFDHERQQFETRADRILLEYIAPFGTTAGEDLYIVGAFNGNTTENEVVLDEAYKLTKAANSDVKWGIYLDPSTFVNGKTLADGFRFYSVTQGMEVDLNGELANHTDNPGVGTFTNIWGQRWEAYYWEGGEAPEPAHDGFVLYVINESSETDLALYAWGDAEAFGGWPGMPATGKLRKGGQEYVYFDLGEANTGLNLNLIPNNNGQGKQWEGADLNFTIDHNIYLRITDDGYEVIEEAPTVKHDGFALFVLNQSSETDLALYAWGDAEAFGVWPGMQPTGTQTINGNEYVYFDMGAANTGLNLHLIPNNNNNGKQWEGDDLFFTIDHDIYVRIYDGGYEIIDKNYSGGGDTPTPDPQPQVEKVIIAVKNSIGYDEPHLYVWGDGEACGVWPGAAPVKVTENGWCLFELPANGTYNLILNNNNNGLQANGPEISTAGSHFFDVNAEWVESPNTVTIQNNAGYTDPRLYAWGAGEIYGGWRGIKPTSNENGTLVFPLPNDGGEYNLILNGEGDGVQQDIATVIANQSYTFTAN